MGRFDLRWVGCSALVILAMGLAAGLATQTGVVPLVRGAVDEPLSIFRETASGEGEAPRLRVFAEPDWLSDSEWLAASFDSGQWLFDGESTGAAAEALESLGPSREESRLSDSEVALVFGGAEPDAPAGIEPRMRRGSLKSIDDPFGRDRSAERGGQGFSLSQKLGEYSTLTLSGAPNAAGTPLSLTQSWSDMSGPLRALETRVETSEGSTLLTAGGVISLWEGEQCILATRLLGGYRTVHDDRTDGYHVTADLYGARPLTFSDCCPQHYVKAGVFIDDEREFGKWGPELGLLLFSQASHPLTVDFAWGIGYGGNWDHSDRAFVVAEDDVQFRLGVLLTPSVQIGGTMQHLRWGDQLVRRETTTGGGGFVNVGLPFGSLLFDVTSTSVGTNAMASLAISTDDLWRGSIVRTVRNDRDAGVTLVQNGSGINGTAQGWMNSPVSRSTTVRVADATPPKNNAAPQAPPFDATDFCLNFLLDIGGNGLNPGDVAGWSLTLTNTTAQVQTYTVVLRHFDLVTQTTITATLNPGQSQDFNTVETIVVAPNNPTPPPDYLIPYSVTVNGQVFNRQAEFNLFTDDECE